MSIKKTIAYYWDCQLKKIEKIETYNGSPFQKVHQKFLNQHKNMARWTSKTIKKFIGDN